MRTGRYSVLRCWAGLQMRIAAVITPGTVGAEISNDTFPYLVLFSTEHGRMKVAHQRLKVELTVAPTDCLSFVPSFNTEIFPSGRAR